MRSKLNLPIKPTLSDFQVYVKNMVEERGFQNQTIDDFFILLIEEIGEVATEIRKLKNLPSRKSEERVKLDEELADMFNYLLCICNYYSIDLEQAYRKKEEMNKKRF